MSDLLDRALADDSLPVALADIAEEAAELILPFWRVGTEVMVKADRSPVTEADERAEAHILRRLEALYPGVAAVAEEAVARDGFPRSRPERFWLVDPLDGTRAFIEGKESYTVNIALIDAGRPIAGVVSAPATGVTWRTGRGRDGRPEAWRRRFGQAWEPIRPRVMGSVGQALVSHSMSDEDSDRLATRHGCAQWQGMDSSIKFCLVAEGRFDVYPRTGPTREWDTAAGQAVLEAAGGRVLDQEGRPLGYGKPEFLNGPFAALGQ